MFGRGLPAPLASVVGEEFELAGAVGVAAGAGMNLAAPTLLAMGSPDLQRLHLPAIATGRNAWCQLFSEPGNGSDLAGLTTKAVRDGDEWVVNGQKVWTTGAHRADYAMLLARTDWDVPKHRGITYFVIDMRQPGVEVRSLRQMNGHSSFNEVFLTEATVANDHVVGEVNGGWGVAMTTLAHERGLGARPPRARNASGRAAEQAAEEARAYNQTYVWYPQRSGRVDLARPRSVAAGRSDDPLVRQAVVDLESLDQVANWTVARAKANRDRGKSPGPEGSVAKLTGSEIARRANRVHTTLAGAHGMLSGPDSQEEGVIAEILVSTPAISIAGGTDEIQHDIVGERALGLPKEPSVDRSIPFREVRTNAANRQRD
jgi:alkylation response protein AidB-like acyl-CoA dehydrogenase